MKNSIIYNISLTGSENSMDAYANNPETTFRNTARLRVNHFVI